MITYSEMFYSIQGEGVYTGVPSIWLRLFSCNLQCNGFGQKDPTDPDSYDLPYLNANLDNIERLEDLPVWDRGCDSSYSWSAKYKHLQHRDTAENIAKGLVNLIPSPLAEHKWPGDIHLCFTGGEPLMPKNQRAIVQILTELQKTNRVPTHITFETNGTQNLIPELEDALHYCNVQVTFSVSPKLFTVSGETNGKAIKPDVISQYKGRGQTYLKFVMGDEARQWDELEQVIAQMPYAPVYIMPVGATKDSQDDISGKVANMALAKGYRVSARVHCNLWGNVIGV